METGYWIPATTPGVFPPELDGYFSKTVFETESAIGGQWTTTFGEDPVYSGFGIINPTVDEDHLVMIDQTIDDGNLNTGTFRKVGAGNYYYILEEY